MVLCGICHNFVGNPCASCRTASRIQFFLTRTQFPPAVEGRLVGILRQAVGEICDVAEQLGSYRAAPVSEAVAPASEGLIEPKEKAKPPVEDLTEKKKDKSKKASKEKRKDEKRKKERSSGVKETPKEETDAAKEEEEDPEALRRKKATPLNKRPREAGSDDPDLQDNVDRYVAKHPEKFGLGSLSIRGSAARHFRASDEAGRERPAEPAGSPPRRHSGGGSAPRPQRPRGTPRERSRSPRRKSKGEKHRQRGRDFWRQVRERDQWRRRFNQRPGSRQRPGPRQR